MIALLDINVLIARADPGHEFHDRALAWMRSLKSAEIAMCPITETGFLRIFGNPAYPGGPGSLAGAGQMLSVIRKLPQFVFLPDDVSLGNSALFPTFSGVGHQQLTDLYLLGLAVHHGARFAAFDRRIDPRQVIGGAAALLLIL